MRLKQIKLAGFKSFVDPTLVPFPTAMTCVVGPNGCGKSNVIDAVRWVLGESSAKNLRGDAMTDVIFNGSAQRKPVSQASVELVFENTEGRVQGSLADRSEISVKRLVTRDSQSLYFLNGSKCRRRDITDIFLGTGLGPRSYAIIEQGMISRLIESRPQDLRVFIEEAAGISKYKERRRETETRISHTRDNLDRLSDVREELGKNLEKLRRQAATAERYKELKATERRLKAELTGLRWYYFNEQLQQAEQALAVLETEYQQFMADGSGAFRALEQLKQQQQYLRDNLAQTQQRFYQLGSQITALEQQQLHQRSRRQQIHDEKRQLHNEIEQGLDQQVAEEMQLAELEAMLLEGAPALELLEQQHEELQQAYLQAEHQGADSQHAYQQAQQQMFLLAQRMQQLKMSTEHLQAQIDRAAQQELRLDQQLQTLAPQALQAESETLRRQLQLQQTAADAEMIAVLASEQQQATLQTQLQQQQLTAKSAALEAAALGQQVATLAQQLERLSAEQPVLPALVINEGWDIAVAVALQALYFSQATTAFPQVAPEHHLLQSTALPLMVGDSTLPDGFTSLAEQVAPDGQGRRTIPAQFWQIFCVRDYAEALSLQPRLSAGQSLICPQGLWLGPNWLIVPDQQARQNPLQLRQQLQDLDTRQQALQGQRSESEAQVQQLEAELQTCAAQLLAQRQAATAAQQLLQQSHNQLQQVEFRLTQQQQQQTELLAQRQQLLDDIHLWQQQQAQQQEQFLLLEDDVAAQQDTQLQLQQQQEKHQLQLRQRREQEQQLNQQLHQLRLQRVSLERQLEAVRLHLARSSMQQQKLRERLSLLTDQLELLDEPDLAAQEELQALILSRDEAGAEKLQLEQQLQHTDEQIRQTEQGQHGVQQQLAARQKQMEHLRLDAEGFRVRANNMLDLLAEQQVNFKDLLQTLPADAQEQVWQNNLEKTTEALSRLGPINLAAIDEFNQQDERKKYLDLQHDDLTAALETLETAIKKIDRETRQKFKATFDAVNEGLQTLFPKVFGGGSAYLDLTDEDLLETGVSIMARPPGKKNSTIHLLSGGEKALTALSLVFSIFRLNPAPFCMLDEVDAPLDDANVGRFCNLVREMSESVQFIYISHNKIAMEMAAQLMGVTMQEPGVSRVVAVDVEDAVKMAQA
jgi:chromosome segregation protein